MLWELSVAEREIPGGAGGRRWGSGERGRRAYGVSRQSVRTWLGVTRQDGISGLEDHSHRVHEHPWRIAAEVELAICELRRAHRGVRGGWSSRWTAAGYGRVTRSTVYRTLVRNGLIEPSYILLSRSLKNLAEILVELKRPSEALPRLAST
jgi:hypothetical protein